MLKKMGTIFLLTAFLFTSVPSFVFANDLESSLDNEYNDELLVEQKVFLSSEEYSDLMERIETDNISTFNKLPERKPTGWGVFMTRAQYTHTSNKGIKQYTHSGNKKTAHNEFSKLGGDGQVEITVSGSNVSYVKSTPAGYVTLYTSTSSTLGAVRPTITHAKDKIRFLGD